MNRAAKKKLRANRRRKAQGDVSTKQSRRRVSLRGNVQMHQRMLAGLILELRKMVGTMQQQRDITNILLEVLCKQAMGRELSDEDKAVLDDFIDECEQAAKAEEPTEQPAGEVPA